MDITDTFTFSNKKPNLQVVETDEKGLFNFHFPKDVEGLEGFDKAVSVMQRICDGATDPSQLPPLVSIPAAVCFTLQPDKHMVQCYAVCVISLSNCFCLTCFQHASLR